MFLLPSWGGGTILEGIHGLLLSDVLLVPEVGEYFSGVNGGTGKCQGSKTGKRDKLGIWE